MNRHDQIEQELAKAAQGLQEGNAGLARVCARRAVAIGLQSLAERRGQPTWSGDAMHGLRTIQDGETFPEDIRQAAQRLTTAVSKQDQAPMSIDPIADARLILAHLDQLS
jgi:uncharacterized protein (UPF0147 family)